MARTGLAPPSDKTPVTLEHGENQHSMRLDAIDDAVRADEHLPHERISEFGNDPTRVRRIPQLECPVGQPVDPAASGQRVVSRYERRNRLEVAFRLV